MPLISLKGDSAEINKQLLLKALAGTPSLIIDCGNSADPHALFPYAREEQLYDVYVMNAEAIYRFRDALRLAPCWAERLGIRCLVITTMHALFSYDDEEENCNVLENCWELMKGLSMKYKVYVGIARNSMHEKFAENFSDSISEMM